MPDQTLLSTTRQLWYQAYFAGDIAKLSTLEHPCFTYICAQGIETVTERYRKIEHAKTNAQWFHPSSQRQDIQVDYMMLGSYCYVSGLAKISSTQTDHERYFSELWQYANNQWQIISLHATISN